MSPFEAEMPFISLVLEGQKCPPRRTDRGAPKVDLKSQILRRSGEIRRPFRICPIFGENREKSDEFMRIFERISAVTK